MMDKLRTLRELGLEHFDNPIYAHYSNRALKNEAIKWIKEFEKTFGKCKSCGKGLVTAEPFELNYNSKYWNDYAIICPSVYKIAEDEDDKFDEWAEEGHTNDYSDDSQINEKLAIIGWIKLFFNITEKELKNE